MQAARREQAWTRFNQWIAAQQVGHLAVVIPEPTEAQYLGYFAHLWQTQRHGSSGLWRTYGMLKRSHQRNYGRDLEEWANIRQSLEHYETEEQRPHPVFHSKGVAYYWIGN